MKVLIVHAGRIPVFAYGGTERVIWDLGKSLAEYGHQFTYLVGAGSTCDFAQVIPLDAKRSIVAQVPDGFDIAHFPFNSRCEADCPYIVTEHGNSKKPEPFGLAIIESRYFGCPVIRTPYGSLPKIVTTEVGTLPCVSSGLVQGGIATKWKRRACHARAKNVFNHRVMAKNYLNYYYNILGGQRLHSNAPVLSFNGHNLLKWTNESDSAASANLSTTPFNGVLQSQGNTKRDFIDR